MSLKYTGVEVALDDQTVFKVGNFLIQKKSDSTLNIYFIPKDNEKIENIEGMLSYNFTNALPVFAICNPNEYKADDGGAGQVVENTFVSASGPVGGGTGGSAGDAGDSGGDGKSGSTIKFRN